VSTKWEVSWYPRDEVEARYQRWIAKHPEDADDGYIEHAMQCEHSQDFKTHDAAVRFAKKKAAIDFFGCAIVTKYTLNRWDPEDGGPMIDDWEVFGTPEEVDP